MDDAAVRQQLLNDYNLEIGAGLGALAGKVWRIGLMGYASRAENVEYCLQALDEVLAGKGVITEGVGVDAARAELGVETPRVERLA